MPKRVFEFKYGMRLRGFSPGAHPKKSFIRAEDDPEGKYHNIVVYGRRLTDREIVQYELDDLNRKDVRALTRYREMAGLKQSELAEKTGIPLRGIQRFEFSGMQGCAIETALLLADTLKCNVKDFVDWE